MCQEIHLAFVFVSPDFAARGGFPLKLAELVSSLLLCNVTGDPAVEITGIETDSRKVEPGTLFIALRGFTVDGHQYVQQAVEKGAAAVMVEEPVHVDVPVVLVPDTRRAMAIVAAHFYQYPTKELKVIGITGTNGKTTTSHLIQAIFNDAGKETGIIGTIAIKFKGKEFPVKNTTPDVVELQKSLSLMRDEGCEYAAIEVSSHALDLGRVRGCEFHAAVFTNLTQDHLDYHQTMEQYREAKGLLFSQLGNGYSPRKDANKVAVINADDPNADYFMKVTPVQVITYGIEKPADVRARRIEISPHGTKFLLETFQGSCEIQLRLIGKFNVYNVLAAISVALAEGIPLAQIKKSVESVSGVNGRFEPVNAGQPFAVIVDYAHTPDSLENVLKTIQEFAKKRVFCVVGCGGDRDRGKRPLMARIAATYSDRVFLTSDNPRTEDPQRILEDMLAGIKDVDPGRYQVIVDRKEAIEKAIQEAQAGDVVLIAGKGHETYQEINGVRYDFDDREVARQAIMRDANGT